jgi:hypothetical protein
MADGVSVADAFPDELHKSIEQRATKLYAETDVLLLEQFLGGWKGTKLRFLACARHSEAYTASIHRTGPEVDGDDRDDQERELFEFFINGLSAVECACFALYAIGKKVSPDKLCEEKEWRIDRDATLAAFSDAFPDKDITKVLSGVRVVRDKPDLNPKFHEWTTIRNMLIHRIHPRGDLYFDPIRRGAKQRHSRWRPVKNLLLDEEATVTRRAWLTEFLTNLFQATDAFLAEVAVEQRRRR